MLPVQERTGLQLICLSATSGCTCSGENPERRCANSSGTLASVRAWAKQHELHASSPSALIWNPGFGIKGMKYVAFLGPPHCLLSLCMHLVLQRAGGHHEAPKGAAPAQRKLPWLP